MQAKSDQILLLDTRDNDEFEVCHVRHSLNILTSKKIDLILAATGTHFDCHFHFHAKNAIINKFFFKAAHTTRSAVATS